MRTRKEAFVGKVNRNTRYINVQNGYLGKTQDDVIAGNADV